MSILEMSFSGAIMILAIVVIRAIFINKLPKKTFLALWGVVFLRLLVPFSIPSVFSAYSWMSRSLSAGESDKLPPAIDFLTAVQGQQIAAMPKAAELQAGTPVSVLPVIWIVGLLCCGLFFAASYVKCRKEFQISLPVENDFIIGWLKTHKSRRLITIRQSGRISAPLTYGVLRPVILMPKSTDWRNTDQLQYVLTHEYIHICRFDAITKLLMTAILCIHWFNPMVWVMYIFANRDIELSCDETVVRRLGEMMKSAYALTLIGMEEKKSLLTPLCNNFSKNAIEERITAIMKMKKPHLFAILAAISLIFGVSVFFATSAEAKAMDPKEGSDNKTFEEEGYEILADFQFEGYENMSVAEYQEKAWTLKDTNDYGNRLEKLSKNDMLYELKDTNAAANFLFYILEPITAEKWKTREFGGAVESGFDASDNASLEYWLSLTILDADSLTVKQYNDARLGVMSSLQKFLQGKSKDELQNKQLMLEAIRIEVESLTGQWSSDSLQVTVEYGYNPLKGIIEDNASDASLTDEEKEPRIYGNGTEEEYQSFLALKTSDYQKMSVTDFNGVLLDWGNENFDSKEKIREDAFKDDYKVTLTEEERYFTEWTTMLSEIENYYRIQSLKTGRPEENPMVYGISLNKEENAFAWCQLYYQLFYNIKDKDKITIGERDRCVSGLVEGIQSFWDETSLDELLQMSESDVVALFHELAAEYSNELITLLIDEERIRYEVYDERDKIE